MSASRPPPVATWLLERLGSCAHRDALIGDLAEQYAGGRSRAWYWHQVTHALLLELARGLQAKGPSLILAMVAGWGLMLLWPIATNWSMDPLGRALFDDVTSPNRHVAVSLFVWSLLRRLVLLASTCLTGWVVARLYRSNPRFVLVLFVGSIMAYRAPWLARLTLNAIGNPRFSISLWNELFGLTRLVLLTLVGGLWARSESRKPEVSRRMRLIIVLIALQFLLSAVLLARAGMAATAPILPVSPLLGIPQLISIAYLSVLLWRSPRLESGLPR